MILLKAINSSGEELLCQNLPEFDFSLTLGRQDACNIQLLDAGVSRQHAQLIQEDGCLFLEDMRSSGGTFVNGKRIAERTRIVPGDDVKLGRCMLVLMDETDVSEHSPSVQKVSAQPHHVPQPAHDPQAIQQMPSSVELRKAAMPPVAGKTGEEELLAEFKETMVLYEPETMALIHSIHAEIVDRINRDSKGTKKVSPEEMRDKAEVTLDQVLKERRHEIPPHVAFTLFRQALLDEIIDLGPIAPLVRSNRITEIMVNGPNTVFVEMKGKDSKSYIIDSGVHFYDERHLLSIIQRIVEHVGRRVDDASPMVDARLADGSRVNAIIPPLVLQGAALTIRKFSDKKLTTDDLIKFGSMTKEMALFLEEAVKSRQNILVSGGTGSGKTTLLNVLSQFIPLRERVITVEDSAELKLDHPNLLSLEARPANAEGKGRITIRDLVINTLRMRPDRIIVGECRGAEALDMLQAMNTGHDGSMTTAHANEPRDALSRLENMVMMAGFELPSKAIREQISSALNLIVQQTRLLDGSRKIVQISEVTGREGDVILMQDIFKFVQTGIRQDEDGKAHVEGYHTATGNIPEFIEKLRSSGNLDLDMSVFVPKN